MRNSLRTLPALLLSGALASCLGSTSGAGGGGGSTGDAAVGAAGASGAGTGGARATGGTSGGGGGRNGGGGAGVGGVTGAGGGGGIRGVGGVTGTGGVIVGSMGGTTGASVSVLQHHNNASRDGLYVDARLTLAAAATMHVDTTFANARVTGQVFAQPLYLAGTAGGPDMVIVATEQNNVYAFNAATGAIVWTRLLGPPAVRSSDLPCGNITPNIGVTGTPVIDAATRTIYLDAMIHGATVAQHQVHALQADAQGADRAGWPVDLNATAVSGGLAFGSRLQNQRAALALVGGRVFVAFGGHVGDCDAYHGWIVGITTANPTQVSAWATTAVAGGIWGSSGIASDGTSLYVSTGNTKASAGSGAFGTSPTSWGGGEAVIKFPTTVVQPPLTQTTDYFFPSGWAALDMNDADLGGTGPVLFTVPGATPSNLVMALGKDFNAYLLNRANLGGMDAAPIGRLAVTGSPIITAAAAYRTATASYVVLRNNNSPPAGCPNGSGGLTAIRISAASPPAMTLAWCGGPGSVSAPAVSTTDANGANAIVWVVASDNRLHGVNGDTGASVFAGGAAADAVPGVRSIQTPIVANGRIFVASDTQVFAFTP